MNTILSVRLFFLMPIALLFFLSFALLSCQASLPFYPLDIANLQFQDHHGQDFHMRQAAKRITLLHFGFTRCPSICPDNFRRLQKLYSLLDFAQSKLGVLFITVDPEYDSPAVLRKYLSAYANIKALGLWVNKKELRSVSQSFHVNFGESARTEHVIDHSSHIFLIDRELRVRYFFRQDDSPYKMARIVRRLL